VTAHTNQMVHAGSFFEFVVVLQEPDGKANNQSFTLRSPEKCNSCKYSSR